MPNRTLGDMRAELLARTGFGATGASAGVAIPNFNSFLQNAQRVLYVLHDWTRLRRYTETTLGVNAYQLDYPAAGDPDRIIGISLLNGTVWSKFLGRGIRPEAYTTRDTQMMPTRWDAFAQIEFNHRANAIYSIRIFYVRACDRFTEDGDRSTVRDDMVFLFALADAKAHYRQPDAPIYQKQVDAITLKLKGLNFSRNVFNPNDNDDDVLPKPVVV